MTQPAPQPPATPSSAPLRADKRRWRAPDWLQLFAIAGLLGSAIFVALDGRYLWSFWLALGGVAFGIAFILRRMVGDEYGRS